MSSQNLCTYLFQQEATELFPGQDPATIQDSLATLIDIVEHLVQNKPQTFFLFDPTAFNNQCHLYALLIAQAVSSPKNGIDRRFVYHAFFLSYATLTSPTLLEPLLHSALQELGKPPPSKDFLRFVKDPGAKRTLASRQALNELFAQHMKSSLAQEKESLGLELARIAQSNLFLPPSNGKGPPLYTYPKFSGVVHMFHALEKNPIPLVFKVKVVTPEGTGSFSHCVDDLRILSESAPAIVFEMIAVGGGLSYAECREIAKRCPQHSRRNPSSKNRHNPKESCQFCTPKRVAIDPYREKIAPILADTKAMLLALGANFVQNCQKEFLPYFSDREKFPELTPLFEKSSALSPSYHLSITEPDSMSVSHVYVDCVARAKEPRLVVEASYETLCQERGLV